MCQHPIRRLWLGSIKFHHPQSCGEDARLDDLDLDSRREVLIRFSCSRFRLVYFMQCLCQFPPYAYPFAGFEVVVLEEEHERVRTQEGGILPEELRLTELCGLIRRRLFSWV